MANHEHHHHHGRQRLKFLKSPVAGDSSTNPKHESDESDPKKQGVPELKRYEEPTLLELFYDLFFAANYTVFSENREVTNHSSFKAYIGYFCLLWLTWFLVTAYDVRFVTDSIFERTARALQLGVLVGFAVVAPTFDPSDQKAQTMRTMSLILMFSRAILMVEYISTLWHVRKYEKCWIPLYDGKRSRVYMTWYFISAAEGIITLIISDVWSLLSFTKTHLMKRLTLITVMILGDGLINIAKEVVTMVKSPEAWDSLTIGLITAGVATIYFVFLIYFDWLRSSFYLPPVRQLLWTALHLPFHLSLVLFMQAFTQYIIWSKVMDTLNQVTNAYFGASSGTNDNDMALIGNMTTDLFVSAVQNGTDAYFKKYPAKMRETTETVKVALKNLTSIPNMYWPQLAKFIQTGDDNVFPNKSTDSFVTMVYAIDSISESLSNNLFQVLGIDLTKDVISSSQPTSQGDINSGMLQTKVNNKTWRRYRLVFAYGYIAAGCCLLLMAILSIISRTSRWKPWPIIRLIILVILALGTGLVSILWFSSPPEATELYDTDPSDLCFQYLQTPWVLLTIFVVYTIVLIITHIGGNGEHINRAGTFFSRNKKQSYEAVSLPLTPSSHWGNRDQKNDQDDANTQHSRSLSPYEMHRPEQTGVAYGGYERPTTGYDPLKKSTEYRGASNV